jgi:hypothetical protein
VIVAAVALGAIIGARSQPAPRAALLRAAAGVVYGYQAAVVNVFVDVLPHGIRSILGSWTTYALIVSALGGFHLLQRALRVGVLAPAIATSNAFSPVTSVALGRVIFLETPQRTTGGKVVSVVSALLLVVGIALLARAQAGRVDGPPGSPAPAEG